VSYDPSTSRRTVTEQDAIRRAMEWEPEKLIRLFNAACDQQLNVIDRNTFTGQGERTAQTLFIVMLRRGIDPRSRSQQKAYKALSALGSWQAQAPVPKQSGGDERP